MKLLFFLHKVGPYHHARFVNLAKSCLLTVVEILPESDEYGWDNINETKTYQRIQLTEHLNGIELKGVKLATRINKILEQCKPDICIVTGWDNRSYFAALLGAKRIGIPVVCISDSKYSDSKRVWYKEALKSILIRPFDGFLVAGTLSREYLKKLKVDVAIYQPWDVVDNKYFSKKTDSSITETFPKPYLLCIARFIWEKNLLEMIKGFQLFFKSNPDSNLNLVIVGDGPLKAQLAEQIESYEFKNIHLKSFMQYNEINCIYSDSKAVILPSIKDTWGLVVNEAMATGKPVIVSENCGCVPDLVKYGKNGFICKPTAISISDSIGNLEKLTEAELISMGQEGKKLIQYFDVQNFTTAVFELYNKKKSLRKLNSFQNFLLTLKLYL